MEALHPAKHLDPVHLSFGDSSLVLPELQPTVLPFDDILIHPVKGTAVILFSETQPSGMPPQTTQCKDVHATPVDLSGEPPHFQAGCSTKMTGIRCESCGKVLSNTSNLGKHMRTACPGLPTKRHPCRYSDLGCSNESTTKWNRECHEKKWCRYNPNRERNKMRIKATS
jgi:phage FluMu protein Com